MDNADIDLPSDMFHFEVRRLTYRFYGLPKTIDYNVPFLRDVYNRAITNERIVTLRVNAEKLKVDLEGKMSEVYDAIEGDSEMSMK